MWNAAAEVLQSVPHQIPSLYQSLLSGLDPVGAVPAPVYDSPSKPMSPVAAAVGPAARSDDDATTSAAAAIQPSRRGGRRPDRRAGTRRRAERCRNTKLFPLAVHDRPDRLQDDPEIEHDRALRDVLDI